MSASHAHSSQSFVHIFPHACDAFSLLLLFSCQVVSDSLRPHGLWHARLPCPSPSPRVCPSSCPLNHWCHPTISSSVILLSFYLQSFPAAGSFPVSHLFSSGGQSIGASASASSSVFLKNIQDWFSLKLTGFISLLSKGFSRVFSRTQFKSINSLVLYFLYYPALISVYLYRGFLGSSANKDSAYCAGDPGLIPGQEDSLEKE